MEMRELTLAECREINGGSQQPALQASLGIGTNNSLLSLTLHDQYGGQQRTTTLNLLNGVSFGLGAFSEQKAG